MWSIWSPSRRNPPIIREDTLSHTDNDDDNDGDDDGDDDDDDGDVDDDDDDDDDEAVHYAAIHWIREFPNFEK